MAKVESEVRIARPVDEVFQFLLAMDENVPKADESVESVTKLTAGPVARGTTFEFRQKMLGRRVRARTTVTKVSPNREIDFEAHVGPLDPIGSFSLEPTDGGTRLTFRGDPRPHGAYKLLSPLFTRVGKRLWNRRLSRIRSALESR